MKKLTIEFIRKQFKKENYTLLSTEYINSKQKLGYTCPNSHKHSIRWDNWQSGKRCPYCSWEKTAQKRRKDIKEIRQAFREEGYQLLTTDYKNSKQKLEYICPVGHRHQIAWEKWQTGVRCFYCFGTPKKTLKEIREAFKKEGFTLLSKNYTGAQQKLDYICPFGHKHSIRWNNWLHGYRCAYCHGNARRNLNDIKKAFEKEGYQLLPTIYKNSEQKLKYVCPKGHKHSIRWRNWKWGARCPECSNQEIAEKAKQRWINPIYQQKMQKAFHLKPNKPEKFLTNLLQKLFPNEYKYVGDLQFFLGGKNPDFLNINSQKKLIEIFGTHWHSPKITGLPKEKHEQDRIDHFKQFGFSTLIIWENELKNQEALVSKLQTFHSMEHLS